MSQRTSQAYPPDVPPLPDFLTDIEKSGSAKEQAERDTRLIEEFCDELTVAIALKKWDQAVSLVEEGSLVHL